MVLGLLRDIGGAVEPVRQMDRLKQTVVPLQPRTPLFMSSSVAMLLQETAVHLLGSACGHRCELKLPSLVRMPGKDGSLLLS